MKADYTLRVCDICKGRIYDNGDYGYEKYGPITVNKKYETTDQYGYPCEGRSPREFKDICITCRNKISDYIMDNLYMEETPKFVVSYDNEVIKEKEK